MQKDEIVEVHENLASLREQYEDMGRVTDEFEEYDAHAVRPNDSSATKGEQRVAVYLLGRGLSKILKDDDVYAGTTRNFRRMSEMVDEAREKV